jgi:hypothetical protein
VPVCSVRGSSFFFAPWPCGFEILIRRNDVTDTVFNQFGAAVAVKHSYTTDVAHFGPDWNPPFLGPGGNRSGPEHQYLAAFDTASEDLQGVLNEAAAKTNGQCDYVESKRDSTFEAASDWSSGGRFQVKWSALGHDTDSETEAMWSARDGAKWRNGNWGADPRNTISMLQNNGVPLGKNGVGPYGESGTITHDIMFVPPKATATYDIQATGRAGSVAGDAQKGNKDLNLVHFAL